MTYPWLIASGIYGFMAVAIGAFAAHGLQASAGERTLSAIETGADYALVHAIVLLALGILGTSGGKLTTAAGIAFALGIALFSGSLFVYAFTGMTGHLWVTPIGGVGLLLGWALIFTTGIKAALAERDTSP